MFYFLYRTVNTYEFVGTEGIDSIETALYSNQTPRIIQTTPTNFYYSADQHQLGNQQPVHIYDQINTESMNDNHEYAQLNQPSPTTRVSHIPIQDLELCQYDQCQTVVTDQEVVPNRPEREKHLSPTPYAEPVVATSHAWYDDSD